MKYYAHKQGCSTLRKIIAETDEEALQKAKELFGTEKVIVGKRLQKAITSQERKRMNKIVEEVTGDIFGKKAREIIHIKNNL